MRTTLALVVLLASSADALRMMTIRMMATGFAPPPPTAAPARSIFRWAEGKGVECGGPLSVREFDGVRGLAADAALPAGTRVLAVPSALALQVTTEQPAPKWADKEVCQAARCLHGGRPRSWRATGT